MGDNLLMSEWILTAHRGHAPATGGQPRGAKRKANYFASLPSAERAIPESWEDDEVLPEAPDIGRPDTLRASASEATDEVAPDLADGAVAAGQSAPPPPEDMGVDPPPAAPQRILRIMKKQKPGFVPPASATAAPAADSDARAPAPPVTKKHAWQHVEHVRKDLRETFRSQSTEEELASVRLYRPADPAATPAGVDTQRGSTTQRGSSPKFTPTAALVVHGMVRDDMHHAPGMPTGNTATAASVPGFPQKAPPVAAPVTGTGLWNALIECHEVRMHEGSQPLRDVPSLGVGIADLSGWCALTDGFC